MQPTFYDLVHKSHPFFSLVMAANYSADTKREEEILARDNNKLF